MAKMIRALVFLSIIFLLVMAYFSSDLSKEGPYTMETLMEEMQAKVDQNLPHLQLEMSDLIQDIRHKFDEQPEKAIDGSPGTEDLTDEPSEEGDSGSSLDPLQLMIQKLQEQDAKELADRVRSIYSALKKQESARDEIENSTGDHHDTTQ